MITYRRNRSTVRCCNACVCCQIALTFSKRPTEKKIQAGTSLQPSIQPIKTCLLHKSEVRQIRLRFVKFLRSSLSSSWSLSEVRQRCVKFVRSSSEVRQVRFWLPIRTPTQASDEIDELLTNLTNLRNVWQTSDELAELLTNLTNFWQTSDEFDELLTNFWRTSYELLTNLTNFWRTCDELLTNFWRTWRTSEISRGTWWFFKKLQKTSS
jgi:hypothetical protein